MYESIRHRMPHFAEMTPEQRKEMFERVWRLRQHVENNQDGFPKPGVALLHDSLTHAALFFVEVYDRERRQVHPDENAAVEPQGEARPVLLPNNGEPISIEAARERLKKKAS